MRTFFMMPPGDNSHNPITIGGASGRVYSCALGATVQVNGDADREALLANGWRFQARADPARPRRGPLRRAPENSTTPRSAS